MSVRGYARHRGVSHVAVIKAIDDGRIHKRKDGKIDSARADRDWAASTDLSKPLNSVTGDPKHRRPAGGPSTPMEMDAPAAGGEETNGSKGFAAARTVRETYKARTAKLEYEQALGKVVDAAEVRAAAFHAGRSARDLVLALPPRLAPVLAAIDDEGECFRVIEEALRQVCEDIGRLAAVPGSES